MIRVYILTTTVNRELYGQRLAQVFEGLETFYIETDRLEPSDFDPEDLLFRDALKSSQGYTLFIKDSAVTLSPACVRETLDRLTNETLTFDLAYLAKWLDRCDRYRKIADLSGQITLYETFSPHGTLALLFSPQGREKYLALPPSKRDLPLSYVLHQAIIHQTLKAVTTHPSLFVFDPQRATKDTDYLRLNECVTLSHPTRPERVSRSITFFVFIVIGAIIAATIFLLVRYGSSVAAVSWVFGGKRLKT